ncbi:MAG: general secretion pathway protein GspK [Gammaproteobacteria bacterium]|nr:general secretion pathway protein GspK [Gammaproteobacteria bacterium]
MIHGAPKFAHSQRGVALITAILMVAIATALAAKMVWDNQLSMRRTQSNINMETAKEIALSAETAAIAVLKNLGGDVGHSKPELNEFNTQFFGVVTVDEPDSDEPIEIGQFYGIAVPANSRININDLVANSVENAAARQQFERLFAQLSSDADIPTELLDSIIDWIDPDINPYNAGAEDDAYTTLARRIAPRMIFLSTSASCGPSAE